MFFIHILVDALSVKERVVAPREWFVSSVQVLVSWRLRYGTSIVVLKVLDMLHMMNFFVSDIVADDDNSWHSDVETDSSPEVGCFYSMVLDSFLLSLILSRLEMCGI